MQNDTLADAHADCLVLRERVVDVVVALQAHRRAPAHRRPLATPKPKCAAIPARDGSRSARKGLGLAAALAAVGVLALA